MDPRCPRHLKRSPQEFCPAAISRLRWRDQLGREPTEEEERSAPGCPWAIRSHENNFCFFKAYLDDKEKLTDAQIAQMLGVSEATVKKTADRAIRKAAESPAIKELKKLYGDESIIQDRPVEQFEDQYNDLSGISISSATEEEVKAEEETLDR